MVELLGEAEVTDLLGTPVKVGNKLAAAFRDGNIAMMKVGTVLGFSERANGLTIVVDWEKSSAYFPGPLRKGAIEADLRRFVVIEG